MLQILLVLARGEDFVCHIETFLGLRHNMTFWLQKRVYKNQVEQSPVDPNLS